MRQLLLLTFNTSCVFLYQVCWVVACFVFSRLPAAFLLFPVSVLLLCRCFFVSFSLPFSVCISFPCMCPYWFLPVRLVLLAFFLCPTPGCRAYQDPGVRRAETRMSDMSRPGCHTMPFRISVFSFSLPLFLSARMRIYYNVSLLPDFPPSLKNMFFNIFVNQRFIKMFKKNAKKSPDIFGVYVIKSYFCTRFREREQRCFDILTGTA